MSTTLSEFSSLVFWSTFLGRSFWKSTYSPFSMRVSCLLGTAAGVKGFTFMAGDNMGGIGGGPGGMGGEIGEE